MIRLETDLRTLLTTSEGGETTSFLYACYTRDVPLPRCAPGAPHGLVPYSQPLITFVIDARIRRIEPGAFYRLPEVACRSLGSAEELSIIPLDVEFYHSPYTTIVEDDYGRAYVPCGAMDVDAKMFHTTRLRYGSWVVCGILRTEQARAWAALDDIKWHVHSTFSSVHNGLDPSWQPFRRYGHTTLAFDSPLLNRTVEVSRETV